MDGVKVTYIETRFVTSDAAGFKDLVQRLTGRPAPPPSPRGGRSAAAAGPEPGRHCYRASSAAPAAGAPVADCRTLPPPRMEAAYGHIGDFSGLLHGSAGGQSHSSGQGGGYYGGYYFHC